MFTCGIDLGSTYTTAAVYHEQEEKLEALTLDMTSPYIPTLVSWNGKKYEYGRAARKRSESKGTKLYKAFKMLLTQKDPVLLEARGFDAEDSPGEIAGQYLCYLTKKILDHEGEQKIDRCVIGAPEIWFDNVSTISGRGILRDLCRRIPGLEGEQTAGIQVVSEPAAACAFFVYQYSRMQGKPLEGYVLLIDYGGGTLDINLAQVSTAAPDGGTQLMQVKIAESTGAGENVENRIGKAGIEYMEAVIEEALRRKKRLPPEESVPRNREFYHAVNSLEEELLNQSDVVSEIFEECGLDHPEELAFEELALVDCGPEELRIDYALLLDVYREKLFPVLDDKLGEMIRAMDRRGICWQDNTTDSFKVAMVGGFCNFYLVRRQIREKFLLGLRDRRLEGMIRERSDCEKAVALGAALIASGKVGLIHTAPFSIAVDQTDPQGERVVHYAFRYKQEIAFDRVYYPVHKEDGSYVITMLASNEITGFLINKGVDERTMLRLPLKPGFRKKLQNMVKNPYRTAVIGFSLDASEVLRVHIGEYDLIENRITEDHMIELARFDELFETAEVERVL